MSRCFFFGHRDAPEAIQERLQDAVRKCIAEYQITEFVVGHYGRFDGMAARAVREIKKEYPQIQLQWLLPYYPEKNAAWLQEYDGIIYPDGMERVPKRAAIVKANEYMIRQCSSAIIYVRNPVSNTWKLMEYANRCGCKIINLG